MVCDVLGSNQCPIYKHRSNRTGSSINRILWKWFHQVKFIGFKMWCSIWCCAQRCFNSYSTGHQIITHYYCNCIEFNTNKWMWLVHVVHRQNGDNFTLRVIFIQCGKQMKTNHKNHGITSIPVLLCACKYRYLIAHHHIWMRQWKTPDQKKSINNNNNENSNNKTKWNELIVWRLWDTIRHCAQIYECKFGS